MQDSTSLAIELELRYRGLRSPHKVKMGVSGCARECAEARSKDFGVIATENGWNLYVGGNGGFRPRHADLFLQDVDTETLVRTIDRFLMFYVFTADRLQRTAPWVEGLDGGLEHLRAVVVDDSLGLCAELDAAMARHVGTYSDEWADTLADPERLSRFVSFVNAPEVARPEHRVRATSAARSSPRDRSWWPPPSWRWSEHELDAASARTTGCRSSAASAPWSTASRWRCSALPDGTVTALGNRDPFSGAMVISRAASSAPGARPTRSRARCTSRPSTSRTGVALDDPATAVPVHDVRVADGQVEVRLRARLEDVA